MTVKESRIRVEEIGDTITNLEKERTSIYEGLARKKLKIVLNNNHLLGKMAMCIGFDSPKTFECVCTGVKALDDYLTVKPLFSLYGKKFIVETYTWVNGGKNG